MPVFLDERLQIFYLNDQRRPRAKSYHPWNRASTRDFIHYTDHGEALAVVEELRSRERALGTGSVIQRGESYHAFYTGHNPRLLPIEVVMHASSDDLREWRRHPESSLEPPADYSRHSFRDPHLLHLPERDEYWMLVTTRHKGDGVIARFVSDDLSQWRDGGVLFTNDIGDSDPNLEVPTLFPYGDYWYLVFSDQHPHRQTQYRIARSPLGPFRRPARPAFDGRGFYAGKVARWGERLLLAGWTPTKPAARDRREFMWGGNLVIHELHQQPDGVLTTAPPKELPQAFAPPTSLVASGGDKPAGEQLELSGKTRQLSAFPAFPDIARITGRIHADAPGRFGLAFAVEDEGSECLIVFDTRDGSLHYYNVPINRLWAHEPQISLDYPFGDTIDIHIYIDRSVLVMYLDGRQAFSTRIHSMPGRPWGVFSLGARLRLSKWQIASFAPPPPAP